MGAGGGRTGEEDKGGFSGQAAERNKRCATSGESVSPPLSDLSLAVAVECGMDSEVSMPCTARGVASAAQQGYSASRLSDMV